AVRDLLAAGEPCPAARKIESDEPCPEPHLGGGLFREGAGERLDAAFSRIHEGGVVSSRGLRKSQRPADHLVERRPVDEPSAPFRREILARYAIQLLVVWREEVPRESSAQVALD